MFANWLNQELKSRGMSQRELSRQLNISQSYTSRICRGDLKPSVDYIHQVAELWSQPVEVLMRIAGYQPETKTDPIADVLIKKLTDLAQQMDYAEKKLLVDLARCIINRRVIK